MAQHQGHYGAAPQATDKYGNPVHHGSTGAPTGYGTTTTGEYRKEGMMDKIKNKMTGSGGGHVSETRTDQYGNPGHHGVTGATTGHGTTTSGAYRKEGVMEKVKDKMPCGGGGRGHVSQTRTDQYGNPVHHGATGAPTGYGTTTTGEHRKEGVMDKIKEKLPGTGGGHHTSNTTTTAPYAGTTYSGDRHHEKKGMMDKIKEKLPGGNH